MKTKPYHLSWWIVYFNSLNAGLIFIWNMDLVITMPSLSAVTVLITLSDSSFSKFLRPFIDNPSRASHIFIWDLNLATFVTLDAWVPDGLWPSAGRLLTKIWKVFFHALWIVKISYNLTKSVKIVNKILWNFMTFVVEELTHCSLVIPYDIRNFSQHWFR